MNNGYLQLMEAGRAAGRDDVAAKVTENFDASLEELIRRARLQAGELSLMIQRLERLRRDIRQVLSGP